MQKADKERLIEELTERLRSADALIVADYRGLTNSQLANLRVELLNQGAQLSVVSWFDVLIFAHVDGWGRTRGPRLVEPCVGACSERGIGKR